MILCGYKQKNTAKRVPGTGQTNAFSTIITSTITVTLVADTKITIFIRLLSEHASSICLRIFKHLICTVANFK